MKTLKKILVVDDDPVVAKSFNRALRECDLEVAQASCGANALDMISANEYEVIYTDMKMPGMTGMELAACVKKAHPDQKIVIVTGYSDLATVANAMALGIEIINKPLSAEMIEKSVKESFVEARRHIKRIKEAALGRQENSVKTQSSSPPSVMDLFLFMIAPVIGLGYVIALPFVGVGALIYLCAKSVLSAPRSVKMVFGLLMGPLVGLAFVVLLPFAGLVGLGYQGVEVLKSE